MTPLDDAHAAMMQDEDSDAARLKFYSKLADTELFVLLDGVEIEDQVTPRLFELEELDQLTPVHVGPIEA